MTPGKCVNETAPVALPQDMEGGGLVEVDQVNQVFHLVQRGGVRLETREGVCVSIGEVCEITSK